MVASTSGAGAAIGCVRWATYLRLQNQFDCLQDRWGVAIMVDVVNKS